MRWITVVISQSGSLGLDGWSCQETTSCSGRDIDTIADEVEEFLTGRRGGGEATRVVATVMFTDVVGSTERARVLGDGAWADLLEAHNARVRAALRRFGGREIDTSGDGFLTWFDSPASAI